MTRFLAGVAVGAAITLVAMVVVALGAHEEAVRDFRVPPGYRPVDYLRPVQRPRNPSGGLY